MSRKKLNLEDIKQECLKHNIECLEEEYVNNYTKMKFKCKCGNVYEAPWARVKSQSQWQCPKCSENKLNLKDIKKECKEHGIECLEEEYENNYTKMEFRCKCGNVYEARWSDIKRNSQWQCSKCTTEIQKLKRKLNLEDIKKECIEHGIMCLEEEYINNATKMKFKCKCGNVYEVKWNHVKSQSKWQCDKCSGWKDNTKLNLNSIKQECLEHETECLEEEYKNSYTKMKFKCKCGNMYETTWSNIKRNNQWQCSKCSKAMSRGEVLAQEYLDNKNILYTTQDSLGCTNPKTTYPLPFDFVIRNNNETIIIEIDGEQHYRSVEYFGGEKGFESTQYRDDIKNEFCKNNGYKLYRIRWQQGVYKKAELVQQLENIMKENNLI